MTFVWNVLLALDPDVLLEGHEGDAALGQRVEDRHDLPEGPGEPRELADDEAVAGLEDARQLVAPPAFLRGLSGVTVARTNPVSDGAVRLRNGDTTVLNGPLAVRAGGPGLRSGADGQALTEARPGMTSADTMLRRRCR